MAVYMAFKELGNRINVKGAIYFWDMYSYPQIPDCEFMILSNIQKG